MENAIFTKNLTKRYGNKTAVDDLSITVPEGELTALLGVNGAGKTTTLRMLTCLSKPDSGCAEIFGHDVVREEAEVKKLVGISTQDTAVAENLTVEENLKFMAEIYLEKKKIRDSVENTIRIFGLDECRRRRAKHLSGGWKRRLSIAMAIIGEPRVLFLDEPTLGLDVLARRDLWRIIRSLKDRMTIVLTTHYMEEAQSLADRIAIMLDGRIAELGTLDELEALTGKKGLEEVFVHIAENDGKEGV